MLKLFVVKALEFIKRARVFFAFLLLFILLLFVLVTNSLTAYNASERAFFLRQLIIFSFIRHPVYPPRLFGMP